MTLNDGDMSYENGLGLQWNTNSDEIYFDFKIQNEIPKS